MRSSAQPTQVLVGFAILSVGVLPACGSSKTDLTEYRSDTLPLPSPVGEQPSIAQESDGPELSNEPAAESTAAVETTVTAPEPITVPGEVVPPTIPLLPGEHIPSWVLGDARVSIRIPDDFAIDPRQGREQIKPGDDDAAHILASWVSVKCRCSFSLSVQPRPPDDAPLSKLQAFETFQTGEFTWNFIDMGDGDRSNVIAITTSGDYMLVITAPLDLLTELTSSVKMERTP
jgi:hypothetical protein